MKAGLTDKLTAYLFRLCKSEILVQCSQFLCPFPYPAMFNSLAQMLRMLEELFSCKPWRSLKRNGKREDGNIAGQLYLKDTWILDR